MRPERRRLPGTTVAILLGLVMALLIPAGPARAAGTFSMSDPFAREVVRRGAQDSDPWHIAHVYDVQYRLRWLGLLAARPNGSFGPRTENAVRAFQKAHRLRVSGVVDHETWPLLIKRTIRGAKTIPRGCHATGWHVCYDRSRHQTTLFHGGQLLNSWLVRGGAQSTPTRVGRFNVFYRDIDHRSHTFGNAPMPYSQFFSGGEAFHGSRFMVDPFVGHSHGCVNMWVEDARQLWRLTSGHPLTVHVYGRWS
jgi:hypothetical protein